MKRLPYLRPGPALREPPPVILLQGSPAALPVRLVGQVRLAEVALVERGLAQADVVPLVPGPTPLADGLHLQVFRAERLLLLLVVQLLVALVQSRGLAQAEDVSWLWN